MDCVDLPAAYPARMAVECRLQAGRSPLGTETARISDAGHAREVRGKVVACAPEPLHEAVVARCVEGKAALP